MAPPPQLEEQLFRMRTRGPLPVLAHPERYHGALSTAGAARPPSAAPPRWWSTSARSTARTARARRESAQRLVKDGLAHACASDVHDAEDARDAGAGIAWLRKKLGDAGVTATARRKPASDLARRAARLENLSGRPIRNAERRNAMATLLEKIKTHDAKVAVIGIGYVGLPLCVEMAKAGFRTTGYDKHDFKVKSVNAGKSYIGDIPDSVLGAAGHVGQARRVDRPQGARRGRRRRHLRADAAQQDEGAGQRLHHDGGRGSEAAAAQGHADRPRVDDLPRLHARDPPAEAARSRGSRSARTSSSASRPSASIRVTRSIRPRTRPRSSAAPRRAASRRSRRCTATSSTRWCRSSSTDAAEMVQAAREHLPRGQHRPRERSGHHVPQARA